MLTSLILVSIKPKGKWKNTFQYSINISVKKTDGNFAILTFKGIKTDSKGYQKYGGIKAKSAYQT
jgi:hypothetical protein